MFSIYRSDTDNCHFHSGLRSRPVLSAVSGCKMLHIAEAMVMLRNSSRCIDLDDMELKQVEIFKYQKHNGSWRKEQGRNS
ncbi:hypothetical protein PR048_014643 [Dryococelus australis]|uniref:Uncharacterized protein n=1 Tax=Dryococelus australis TaxID=614101 RepID=A0ABQ9HEZ3_9NEOP|nr:hypothetical protein PR048_014643 [Dryococelus australis]